MSTSVWVAPLDRATLTVEIAFGADLTDTEGSGWVWTDVTTDVRMTPGISTRLGRGDEASTSQPAECSLVLDNRTADYSLGGHSRRWPYIRRGTPLRVQIDPGVDDPAGDGDRVVFLGFADGWTPSWAALGRIPVVTLTASGTLRRLLQGQSPLRSAYRRSTEVLSSALAYWPMEEAQGALHAPASRGGASMTPTEPQTVRWGSSQAFECSGPLPDVGGSGFVAVVDPYTATGQSQVRFFVIVPDDGLADGTVLAYVYTTGTLGRWDIVYATGGNLSLFRYNQDGTLNSSTTNVSFDMDGNRRRLELQLTQDGSDVDWFLGVLDANPGDPGGGISGTISGRTFGTVSQVFLTPGGGADGTVMGHLEVHDALVGTFDDAPAFWAWQRRADDSSRPELPSSGTVAASRLHRLCDENGIALTRFTGVGGVDPREGMGPQLVRTLVELLRECEDVDQGQLWDGQTPGLTMTTRRYREDGTLALALDAAAGELGPPFAPTDDDQRTRNRVSVSRTAGVTATHEDTDGALGTAVIGVYDTSLEINGSSDVMVIQHAGWAVSLGTVQGYRYPSVTVDLRACPQLAGTMLDLVPGSRVQILNPDHALTGFAVPTVDLIVEGIAHTIDAGGWQVTLTCSWASPWLIAQAAADTGDTSEFVLRGDTDGSSLVHTRTNLCPNPAAKNNALGFFGGGSRVTTATGLPRTTAYENAGTETTCPRGDVVAGRVYRLSAYVKGSAGATTGTAQLHWRSGGSFLSAETAVPFTVADGEVLRVDTGAWTAPATADGTLLNLAGLDGDVQVTAILYEQTSDLRDYFDGDDGAWSGTAGNSTSTIVEPVGAALGSTSLAVATPSGPLWTTTADDYPLTLDVGGVPVVATACSGASSPQTFTVTALEFDRPVGAPVKLWDPRPLGL